MSAIETLIVWEDLDITRHTLRTSTGEQVIVHTSAPPPSASNSNDSKAVGIAALSEVDRAKFLDKATGLEMDAAAEPMSLLEWLAENHTAQGAALEIVSNKSQEGAWSRTRRSLSCVDPLHRQPIRALLWRHRRPAALQGRLCHAE
jgi:peptide chain release factor subunit 1